MATMNGIIETIDLSDYPGNLYNNNETWTAAYDKTLCQDNKDFTKFINKCILLEETVEMERIIQKILLPAYVRADDDYKTSEQFTRVIRKAIQRLRDEPMKKYSHINDVTTTLKCHVKTARKKRINFVTLSTTTSVLGKSNEDKRKRGKVDNISHKTIKKSKMDVIAVDSEDKDDDDDDDFIAIVEPVKESIKYNSISLNGIAKKTNKTVNDYLQAVDVKVKKTVDSHLLTVNGKTKKTDDDNLIAVNDEAEISDDDDFDDDLPAVDLKGKNISGDHLITDDTAKNYDDLIVVESKPNDVKVDNSVATTKPKLENNKCDTKTKIKTKPCLKLKKSKHTPATAVEPEDESYKNTSIQIKHTKLKESKEKNTPNDINDVENNNTPIEILSSQEIKIDEEMEIDNNERNTLVNVDVPNSEDNDNEGVQNDKENLEANENNKLLVPRMEITYGEKKPNDVEKSERIKVIEAEILKYKKKIADLEVAEVTEDSAESAYIRCDRLQAHIVKLYKELCTLNEEEPVKGRQRQVTLELTNGQAEGPLKRLERFLNKQVDEDGVASFPDFADVVRCVEKSNIKDGLGWSKGKVHREAQALFEYCGRALQKRRQRREWKDLRSKFSREDFDADPAADDAELAAKLDLNRQLAQQKEAEILEEFTRKESGLSQSEKVSIPQNEVKNRPIKRPDTDESDTSSSDEETTAKLEKPKSNITEVFKANVEPSEIRIKEEPYETPATFKGDISVVIKISDSDSSDSDDLDYWIQRL